MNVFGKDNNASGRMVLGHGLSSDKQILALDALSNLARQFSNNPEFEKILEVFMLTLLGQFTATNSFILFAKTIRPGKSELFYATGSFRNNELISKIELNHKFAQYFMENKFPQKTEDLRLPNDLANFKFFLSESGVEVIAPMIHNNNLIGLVGLGAKVNKKDFDESDIEILFTIMNTVTPFVANTFLFLEMNEMGQWYLSILNNVKQGLFVFNKFGHLKKINNSGFEIIRQFKPTIETPTALHQVPIKLIFPDSVFTGWWKLFKDDIQYNREVLYENMKAKSENIEKIFNVRISTITDPRAETTDFILTLDDVTEQIESEQRLFNLEKLADKGMMVASITHELNNYLGLMMGGVELASLMLEKGKVEKACSTLEKLNSSVHKMKRFTEGLTDFAKMETAKTITNLNKIITDVMAFVSVQQKFRMLKIVTELDSSIPEMELDADQISQVLINCLNNGADSIAEQRNTGGLIQIITELIDDKVRMEIIDNGKGIEPELKEKMFRNHFTTKTGGHGYGLVTSGKILRNHSAEIEITSEPGEGARFIFTFSLPEKS